MKPNTKKIYAFIDSQNLNLGVRNSFKKKLDFKKFRVYLKEKYNVQKAYLFIGFVDKNTSLYQELQEAGYILILKPTLQVKANKSAKVKGNVDAELVLHTMIQFKNYDHAIIVSGDGDFHCLIEYLEKRNKLKKIIVPSGKYSSLLRKFGRFIVPVKLFLEKVT